MPVLPPLRSARLLAGLLAGLALAPAAQAAPSRTIGELGHGARAALARNADASWGLRITGAGAASARQPRPAAVELDPGAVGDAPASRLLRVARGYTEVQRVRGGLVGRAVVPAGPGVRIAFVDRWSVVAGELRVARRVAVRGTARGGFLSALTLRHPREVARGDVDEFAPGVLYGPTADLPPDGRPGRLAIGSAPVYGAGFGGVARIREDRLAAPLFGVRFRDGSSLSLLHAAPDGATTAADGSRTGTLVDARLRFGALGSEQPARRLVQGFWFPGTEGEVSYELRDADADNRHRWLRREHPLRDGLVQRYALRLRVGRAETLTAFRRSAWRWAWRTLAPTVQPTDLGAVRRSVARMVRERIVTTRAGTGIANDFDAVTGQELFGSFRPAVIGFIGRDVENAALLIQDAVQHPSAGAAQQRAIATRLIDSFAAKLPMSPPAGAGFDLGTGAVTSFYPDAQATYLRQVSDDFKALAHLLAFERRRGREHPAWLAWSRSLADWLLTQQRPDGSFPRAWANGSGVVVDASPTTTDNPVGFLLDLSRLTGSWRYRDAALRAGAFAARQHATGCYAGATIDQGDVTSSESAVDALEAALALHQATGERRWLAEARRAADMMETWTYLWDVPMPVDGDARTLAWKPRVPTTGLNLTAAGVSGAGEFLGQTVPELTRLGALTGDGHYADVARLMLHDAHAMLALPGRTYDLAGPGWQQEFWTLSAPRGTGVILGRYRDWVPWIAAAKLRPILWTEQQDPAAYRRLSRP